MDIVGPTLNARVAGAGSNLALNLNLTLGLDQGGLGLERGGVGYDGLGCDGLGGGGDDQPILHEALDQPVIVAWAALPSIDAGLAEVIVALLTDAAVVVLARDDSRALVAVDREGCAGRRGRGLGLVADGVLALVGHAGQLCKPLLPCSGTASDGDWNLSARRGGGGFNDCGCSNVVRWEGRRGPRGWGAAEVELGSSREEELLELTLELGNTHGLGALGRLGGRGLGGESWSWSWSWLWRGLTGKDGSLLGQAGDLVLDGGRLGDDGLPVCDGDLQTQLQLGLGGTVELLVDGDIGRVERDKGRSTVRVALEDGVGGGRDLEQGAKLLIAARARQQDALVHAGTASSAH